MKTKRVGREPSVSEQRRDAAMMVDVMILAGEKGLLARELQEAWDAGKVVPLRRPRPLCAIKWSS